MIRWFTDLPIERKLRAVILLPAAIVFVIALTTHVATNLLHLRKDMLQRASWVANMIGPGIVAQLKAGDRQAAAAAANVFRNESMVQEAEILPATGRALLSYRRVASATDSGAAAARPLEPAMPWLDPSGPRLFTRGSSVHVTAPVIANGQAVAFIHIVVGLTRCIRTGPVTCSSLCLPWRRRRRFHTGWQRDCSSRSPAPSSTSRTP